MSKVVRMKNKKLHEQLDVILTLADPVLQSHVRSAVQLAHMQLMEPEKYRKVLQSVLLGREAFERVFNKARVQQEGQR
jgi:hypothetical protein